MSIRFPKKLVNVGGSLKVTIPKPICENYNYRANEDVEVYANNRRIVIERVGKESEKTSALK